MLRIEIYSKCLHQTLLPPFSLPGRILGPPLRLPGGHGPLPPRVWLHRAPLRVRPARHPARVGQDRGGQRLLPPLLPAGHRVLGLRRRGRLRHDQAHEGGTGWRMF